MSEKEQTAGPEKSCPDEEKGTNEKLARPQKVFANMWFNGNAAEALDFYVKAFECKKIFCMKHDDCVVHACIQFHGMDNMIFLSDVHGDHNESGPQGSTTVNIYVYVEDVDKAFERAENAGCRVVQKPETQFWGDRTTRLQDPFGHSWVFASRAFEPEPEKMKKEGAKWWSKMKEIKRKRKREESTTETTKV